MMKSKKWKIVQLKDSKLIKIRTNLRKLLKEAIRSEIKRLGNIRILYRMKSDNKKLTPSQWKREISLIKKGDELLSAWGDSFLICSYGTGCMSYKKNGLRQDLATLNEDMVWNPLQKHWICINCYDEYFKTSEQKNQLQKICEKIEREEEAYEEWFEKNS